MESWAPKRVPFLHLDPFRSYPTMNPYSQERTREWEQPNIIQMDSQKRLYELEDEHGMTKFHDQLQSSAIGWKQRLQREPCRATSLGAWCFCWLELCSNKRHKPNPTGRRSAPSSANQEETMGRDYRYCVKVVRWLECAGHMEGVSRQVSHLVRQSKGSAARAKEW
ncbi:hypothetical protein HPP92_013152 [Vanilla planifolia]|uniref:Uncharacterized protein n=1 Tax=Vanilla planifolia TaxID=51239 RepID=A0A835QSG9_VANPL|nr:hypothetical protein HPP92_013152 [Vanilla planifolia]